VSPGARNTRREQSTVRGAVAYGVFVCAAWAIAAVKGTDIAD
jgi:hypothetical protein